MKRLPDTEPDTETAPKAARVWCEECERSYVAISKPHIEGIKYCQCCGSCSKIQVQYLEKDNDILLFVRGNQTILSPRQRKKLFVVGRL